MTSEQPEQQQTSTEFEEFKILAINSPFLWRRGVALEGGEEEEKNHSGYDINNIAKGNNTDKTRARLRFDKDGISLMSYKIFLRTKTFPISITTVSVAKPTIDFAIDHCEIMYILDCDAKKILVHDLNSGLINSIQDLKLSEPKAIQIDKNEIYILDSNNILIFSKTDFQQRMVFRNIGTNPSHFALDTNGNIFVLDSFEKQVYKIITSSGQISVFFKESTQVSIDEATDIDIGKRDDYVYILDAKQKIILMINPEGLLERFVNLGNVDHFVPSSVAVYDMDNIFVGNTSDKEFPFPRKYSISGKTELLGYSRPSHKILLNRNGNTLYVINLADRWIIKMELVERFVSSAIYISKALDSGIMGVQWHKFVLEHELPDSSNNSIEVSYYASDNAAVPPPPSFSSINDSNQWITASVKNPVDSLMVDARGRYLWFKISLFSKDNLNTPKVYSIKAYLPRLSYLRYLPAIYQEDESSKEFLQRFLSLFETFFTDVDEEIISFTKFTDSNATPDDFLPWLASWLALSIDENWTNKAIRELIKRAPALYRKRGTRKGLEEIMLIYLDHVPQRRP
jgi:phage tail-like protein